LGLFASACARSHIVLYARYATKQRSAKLVQQHVVVGGAVGLQGFIENLIFSRGVKNFENQLRFDEVG